jgi:hypothetical protein
MPSQEGYDNAKDCTTMPLLHYAIEKGISTGLLQEMVQLRLELIEEGNGDGNLTLIVAFENMAPADQVEILMDSSRKVFPSMRSRDGRMLIHVALKVALEVWMPTIDSDSEKAYRIKVLAKVMPMLTKRSWVGEGGSSS